MSLSAKEAFEVLQNKQGTTQDFIDAAETILKIIEVALNKNDKIEVENLKKILNGFSLIAETIPEGIRNEGFQIHFMWRELLMKVSTTAQIVKSLELGSFSSLLRLVIFHCSVDYGEAKTIFSLLFKICSLDNKQKVVKSLLTMSFRAASSDPKQFSRILHILINECGESQVRHGIIVNALLDMFTIEVLLSPDKKRQLMVLFDQLKFAAPCVNGTDANKRMAIKQFELDVLTLLLQKLEEFNEQENIGLLNQSIEFIAADLLHRVLSKESMATFCDKIVEELCTSPDLTGTQMDLRVNFIRRMRDPCLKIYFEQALRELHELII